MRAHKVPNFVQRAAEGYPGAYDRALVMPARRQARSRQGAVFTLLWLAPGVVYRFDQDRPKAPSSLTR
jgi:hypothetical protein